MLAVYLAPRSSLTMLVSLRLVSGLWQAKDASRDELQRVSRAIDEGHPISAELPLSTKLGGRIWSQMSMTPVMSESDPSIVENHVRPSSNMHACGATARVLKVYADLHFTCPSIARAASHEALFSRSTYNGMCVGLPSLQKTL